MKLNVLKETIKEKGFRLDFIAKQLKLSTYGFSLKLNGKNEFKWSEIEKIVELLKLDEKERKKIFLISYVIIIHEIVNPCVMS